MTITVTVLNDVMDLSLSSLLSTKEQKPAYAFHTQTTDRTTSMMQELVQSIDVNMNKTLQSIQNKNISQSLSNLLITQQQLSDFKNLNQMETLSSTLSHLISSSPSSIFSGKIEEDNNEMGSSSLSTSGSNTANPLISESLPPSPSLLLSNQSSPSPSLLLSNQSSQRSQQSFPPILSSLPFNQSPFSKPNTSSIPLPSFDDNTVNVAHLKITVSPFTSSSNLNVTSMSNYLSGNVFYLVGEVLNKANAEKNFVKVITTFYDKNNTVIGTSFTYTHPLTILPSESAPFKLKIDSNDVTNINTIKSAKLRVSSN